MKTTVGGSLADLLKIKIDEFAMSTSAFSTSDDVISRTIDCQPVVTDTVNVSHVYEIDRCVSWIQQSAYRRVALQFPDNLLVDAPAVASKIQQHLGADVSIFILGDTSYGSCCVDEVGAQHYQAECVIHYGRACLSPTSRLPVLYVFGQSPIDVQDCVDEIVKALEINTKIVLVYDTIYGYAADGIHTKLRLHFDQLLLSQLLDQSADAEPTRSSFSPSSGNKKDSDSNTRFVPNNASPTNCTSSQSTGCIQNTSMSKDDLDGNVNVQEIIADFSSCISKAAGNSNIVCKCGRRIALPSDASIEEYTFVFIGSSDSPALLNMIMTFNKCPFYSYIPSSERTPGCQKETLNVNKALMKRFYLIERAKDAKIIGIVAGTLGVARYTEMINHLKQLVKMAGKKSYTFVVGKLNPAKLANFAEIDIYVLVACPESSILDQADFYRPVVSPLEMELAYNSKRLWTSDYSADFRELLPGGENYMEPSVELGNEASDVSLINNQIRTLGMRSEPEAGDFTQQAVAVRTDATVANLSENAGEYFTTRSWQGLERKLGETPVVKATEGQHGIAASYTHEPLS